MAGRNGFLKPAQFKGKSENVENFLNIIEEFQIFFFQFKMTLKVKTSFFVEKVDDQILKKLVKMYAVKISTLI